MGKRTSYKISLGSRFLARARFIFGLLFLLVVLSFGGVVVAGYKTGEFQKKIIDPIVAFANGVGESLKTPLNQEASIRELIATNSANIDTKVEIRNEVKVTVPPRKDNIQYYQPVYPTTTYNYDTKSYDQALKEQQDWFDKVHAENNQKSLDSQKALEQFKADSQKKMDEFIKQSQIDAENFSKAGQ